LYLTNPFTKKLYYVDTCIVKYNFVYPIHLWLTLIIVFVFPARFAIALGDVILRTNKSSLKLDGVHMFAPYLDPKCQTVDCGTFYYNLGLITEKDKEHMDQEAQTLSLALEHGRLEESTEVSTDVTHLDL